MQVINTRLPLEQTVRFLREKATLFNEVPDSALEKIAQRLIPSQVKAGFHIIEQGETGESLYIVVKGKLEVFVASGDDGSKKVGEITSGDCVGEGALVTSEPRTATVVARTDCRLLTLSRNDFQDILKEFPSEVEVFVRIVSKRSKSLSPSQFRPSPEKLREFLCSVDLMASLGEDVLAELEPRMQWIFLPGGETLMKQGDPGDSMYIVVNGRLRYIVKNNSGEIVAEGEISRGDIMGEMSLLTGEKRSATVYATRGCELVRFSTDTFEGLIAKNPGAMLNITRTIALRLKGEMGKHRKKKHIKVITLLPLYQDLPYEEFARKLRGKLSENGSVFFADKQAFAASLGHDSDDLEKMQYTITDLFSWFYRLEDEYSMVIIISDPLDKIWTETSLRHTDKVYLLADHKCSEILYPVEIRYLSEDTLDTSPERELVLLYSDSNIVPLNTEARLKRRKLSRHHHVRLYKDEDFARLARNFNGRSIGIALGGGGAKGFAHIGLLKAFLEFGIPIDIIGGTSAGSIMASFFALGYGIDDISRYAKLLMVEKDLLTDYTYPMVSLIRGRKYTRAIKEFVGDKKIEDMWIPYFAVATDLTLAQKKVFTTGDLWKAVRASTSLPGILPPLFDDGSVYVDGGLLDNIPGSVLKPLGSGINIAVSLGMGNRKARDEVFSYYFSDENQGVAPSVFQALGMSFSRKSKKQQLPTMGNLIMRSTMVNSLAMANSTRKEVDLYIDLPVGNYSIFAWKDFDDIVQTGYNYARENLDLWRNQLGL